MKTLTLLLCLIAAPLSAQTTNTIGWDFDVPPAEVATYTNHRLLVDNVLIAGTPTCGPGPGQLTLTSCTLVIPALSAGSHTLTITVTKGGVTAETKYTGIDPASGAHNARNIRIVLTVTVIVP